ncbi:MAG: head-tail connector protein [Verrucomicrobiota bacterium]
MSRPDASTCICVTQPEEEPVSLFELKAHLRVDGSDEDNLLSMILTAARERIEQETRRALIRQQWTAYIKNAGCGNLPVELPRPRLMPDGVLLEYRDTAGAWHASTDFMVQSAREPALLWITASPSGIDSPRSPEDAVWRVTYWSGYGSDSAAVPGPLKHAILLLSAHLEKNREIVSTGASVSEIPKSLDWMLDPCRVPWGGGIK